MRESKIEDHLKKCAKRAGGETRKVKWIGRRNAPDQLVMLPERTAPAYNSVGSSFYVELKAPKKGPTAAQAREHRRMRACNLKVFVASTIEEVEELFK